MENWTPRDRPGQEPLVGTRVALEPLDWDIHGKALFEAIAGKRNHTLWDYMPIGPFDDRKEFQKVFGHVVETQSWETLVIRRKGSGETLGSASYMRIREPHGSAEVGCVAFGDDLKRTPEATEAMYLMAHHVFEDLGYRRYEWKCDNANDASRRAAERFGFAFEGVFRNDMVVKGESRDTAWFAMTDADWPAIQTGFETWLSPDNFDASGQQRRSLAGCR